MEQKFKNNTFVYVKKITNKSRLHFTGEVLAIVQYTMKGKYGWGSYKNYSLYLIGDDNKISYTCAWYPEEELIADTNITDEILALELIKEYENKA